MTAYQVGRATAGTPLASAVSQCLDHLGMTGQSKIIITGKINIALTIDHHVDALRAFQHLAMPIQAGLLPLGQLRLQFRIQTHPQNYLHGGKAKPFK